MHAVTQLIAGTSNAKPMRCAGLVGVLLAFAAGLTLAAPASAQFGFSVGGFGFGSRSHGGTRPGYGMGGSRPGYGHSGPRPGYGMGGAHPGHGMGGMRPGYGMGGPRPGYGMGPGGYGRGDGGARPPIGTRPPYGSKSPYGTRPPDGHGHAGRPRPYPTRPPVVARPHLPPWHVRPGYPVRLRPPVVVARPPAAPPPRLVGPGPRAPAPPPRGPAAAPPSGPPPIARAPVPVPPRVTAERSFVDREVLIEVAGGQSADAIRRIAAQNGLTLLGSTDLALAGTSVHRLRINGRRSVDGVVDALGRDGRVALAQRNHLYRLQVDGGQAYYPLASRQFAVGKLRLPDAHRMATGEGITVAVIDSGVDTAHPDLEGAIGASENTLSSAAKPDLHGTAIAGAIAARGQLLGVAPKTRIVAIRAFAPATKRAGAEGTSWDIVRAMELAARAGARVVNLSFAGPADRLMQREIGGGLQRGMVFVAAAGNAGAGAPPAYPAAHPGVIAVTATDLGDQLYASANRGSYVTVAAPGVDVLVASPNAGYDMSSGTSVAAAHVSGVVALMLQREPNLTPDAIRSTLAARAKDLGPAGPDPEFGSGLVDAYAALAPPEPPAVATAPAPQPVVVAPAGAPPPPPALASGPPGPPPVAVMPPGPPAIAPMGSPPPPPPMASADPLAPVPSPGSASPPPFRSPPAAPTGSPPPPPPEATSEGVTPKP